MSDGGGSLDRKLVVSLGVGPGMAKCFGLVVASYVGGG